MPAAAAIIGIIIAIVLVIKAIGAALAALGGVFVAIVIFTDQCASTFGMQGPKGWLVIWGVAGFMVATVASHRKLVEGPPSCQLSEVEAALRGSKIASFCIMALALLAFVYFSNF